MTGAALVTVALMLAVYGVVGGNEAGWTSTRTLGILALAVGLLVAFVIREARVENPLVPLRLFTLRNVAISQVVGVLWAGAMFACFFLSALYLQGVLGYDALQVGLAYLPSCVVMAVMSLRISDKLVMKYGVRPPLVARPGPGGRFAGTVRDGAGRRHVRRARAAPDGAARPRRRHRLQPGAAGRDGRRRAPRGRPGLGRGQHLVHDGRRARPGRAGRDLVVRTSSLVASGSSMPEALTGGYQVAFAAGAVMAALAAVIGGVFLRPQPMDAGAGAHEAAVDADEPEPAEPCAA